jgi:small subunit ribosomal protein S21
MTKVYVKENDNIERAIRKFKKKVADSGKLQGLREREFYEKPTTRRKKALAAAKNRWRKKVASEQLPKKMF